MNNNVALRPSWCSRVRAIAVALVVLAVVLPAPPVWAGVDPAKAARAMADQGSKAYESGDFARAAQLYLEAWRVDPGRPVYLYSAARAEHVGGQAEAALDHYRQFAGVARADAVLVAKSQGYASDIRRARVAAKVADAEQETRRGHPGVAAQLYLEAFQLAGDRWDLLFQAAVAEQAASDATAARKHLKEYLDRAPPGAADRAMAKARLDAIAAPAVKPAATTAALPPVAPPPVPARATAAPAGSPGSPVAAAAVAPVRPVAAAETSLGAPASPATQPSALQTWGPWLTMAAGLAGVGLGVAWNIEYNHYTADRAPPAERTAAISAYAAGGAVVATGLGWWLWQRLREP